MRLLNWLGAALAGIALAESALAQNKVPAPRPLEALVKSSLLSFNDANVTGNYSVFHAKLSKPFRDQYPVEDLKQSFREFAEKRIDLVIIAAFSQVYEPPPKVDDDGKLVVKGYFPTEPVRVLFDLEYIPSDGQWKLLSIHVETTDRLK